MSRLRSAFLALGACVGLVGCSASGVNTSGANVFTIYENTHIEANIALGIALGVYLVYDPLAPNWEIREERINPETYRLSMKLKRFHTGGAGEPMQILKRRALQLQGENFLGDYRIVDYTESIDSQTLGARRIVEGTVRFAQREEADSYGLSARNQ